MSYTGYSIQTKAELLQEVADRIQDVSGVRALAVDVSGALAQEVLNRAAAVSQVAADLQTEASDRATAVSGLDSRLSPLEDWKSNHEVAIHNAVDLAISNNTTLIGQVESALNNADSALSQRISQHIVDRVASDEDHIAKLAISSANDVSIQQALQALMTYLNAFSQTYSVYDASQQEVVLDVAGINTLVNAIAPHEADPVVNSEAQEEQQQGGVFGGENGTYEFLDVNDGVVRVFSITDGVLDLEGSLYTHQSNTSFVYLDAGNNQLTLNTDFTASASQPFLGSIVAFRASQ